MTTKLMSRIETYTPAKQPIPMIVISEPRVFFVERQRPDGTIGRLRQVAASVVQKDPNSDAVYVQHDVLLNFAVSRETMVDPTTGERFGTSMLPEFIPGLDVDPADGHTYSFKELLERVRDVIVERAGNGGQQLATAQAVAVGAVVPPGEEPAFNAAVVTGEDPDKTTDD